MLGRHPKVPRIIDFCLLCGLGQLQYSACIGGICWIDHTTSLHCFHRLLIGMTLLGRSDVQMKNRISAIHILLGAALMFPSFGAGAAGAEAASLGSSDSSSDPWVAAQQAIADGTVTAPSELATAVSSAEVAIRPSGRGTISPNSQSIATVICTSTMDGPHVSLGAGGMIFKVRVTCAASNWAIPAVSVRIRGNLALSPASCQGCPAGPIQNRASSDQTQIVGVNGSQVTFYVPQVGSSGGYGTGYWYYTHTIQIVSPQVGNVGSDTQVAYKNAI